MKRVFLLVNLLFIHTLCFSQQNLPAKIIGQIPDSNSKKLYRIQVGAFKLVQNADITFSRLVRGEFNPVYERYLDYTRVLITEIPAKQVRNYLIRLKRIGFNEVIIREEPARYSIELIFGEESANYSLSEKWEITTPNSPFASFEFNQDNNFIAIENAQEGAEEKPARFGTYTMPSKDLIEMENLGVVRIRRDSNNKVEFSFYPIETPNKETRLSASKAERMPENFRTDLFCRTWRVKDCTDPSSIGFLFLISDSGTYFFTSPDGEINSMSKWRWYDNKTEEFEYTHDNWEHYGRAKIIDLKENYLKFFDPGYYIITPGYSKGEFDDYWELEPVNN